MEEEEMMKVRKSCTEKLSFYTLLVLVSDLLGVLLSACRILLELHLSLMDCQ